MAVKYRLYKVEQINFLENALGFLCGCRILLSTLWRFHCQIFHLLVCRHGRNAHFDACMRRSVHHIFWEENVIHCWAKFGTSSSKFRPSMYDTNQHVHACVCGSKLIQHKVFMTEFRVCEACYGLFEWYFSINLEYQQQWLQQWQFDYQNGTSWHTGLGWSSYTWPSTSRAILSWSSLI